MLLKIIIVVGAIAFFLYKLRKRIAVFFLRKGSRYMEKKMKEQMEQMREEQMHGETVMRDKDFTVHRRQQNKGRSSGSGEQYVDFEEVDD